MKKKTAIIIEVYEEIHTASTSHTVTKRIEVYSDYGDGYGFGTVCILPNITPIATSSLFTTINALINDEFNIKIKFLEKSKYSDETIKNLLN